MIRGLCLPLVPASPASVEGMFIHPFSDCMAVISRLACHFAGAIMHISLAHRDNLDEH